MIIKILLIFLYVTIACLLTPPSAYILVKFMMGDYSFCWIEIRDVLKTCI